MFYSALESTQIIMIVLVVALVLVLVIMPIFTNKKRQNSVNQLHSSLKPGDKIMTIGGIIGTVLAVNQTSPVDKEIVIETGVGEKMTTMVLDIKALYQVLPAAYGQTPAAAEPVAATEVEAENVSEENSAEKQDKE